MCPPSYWEAREYSDLEACGGGGGGGGKTITPVTCMPATTLCTAVKTEIFNIIQY